MMDDVNEIGKRGLQAKLARVIAPRFLMADVPGELARRLALWAPSLPEHATLREWVACAGRTLAKGPPQIACHVLRLWCNGWATSHRTNAGLLPCRLGCAGARASRSSGSGGARGREDNRVGGRAVFL